MGASVGADYALSLCAQFLDDVYMGVNYYYSNNNHFNQSSKKKRFFSFLI
jgi:hypothetical protein